MEESLNGEELSRGLSTRRIGRRIQAHDSADSTMEVAHRLARAGELEGTVVVSEEQTQGRGRLGRRWVSPKGQGIYLSVLLRPKTEPSQAPGLTVMSGVAVAQAIQECTGLRAQLKWPNDLMLGGRKAAGILTESSAEADRMDYCVVGIGINVNTRRQELLATATSLAEELGRPVDRLRLARSLLEQMDRCYEQFLEQGLEPILESWRRFAGSTVC